MCGANEQGVNRHIANRYKQIGTGQMGAGPEQIYISTFPLLGGALTLRERGGSEKENPCTGDICSLCKGSIFKGHVL